MDKSTDMKASACWTPDCNGKQDYDGQLLDISTRYWPAWKSSDNRPSAKTSILVRFGTPDEYGFGDYRVWREADFSADTENEVKVLVEAWVQQQFEDVLALLGPLRTP